MAMRPRGGAQVPRSQFIVRPTYDDFEPKYDQKEEPTAHILHVHLHGFTREQLKVTYVESARKIKVRGERPLGNYRWSRFEKEFSIPDSCVGTQIKGKFERNVLMITMPKKVIITPLPPQQPEANKTKPAPPEPKKTEQAVPPNPASDQKPKQDKPAGPSSPNKATTTSTAEATSQTKPQKGKQDHPQKPTSPADLAKNKRDEKALSPPKVTNQTRSQKGEQDHPLKPTSAADLAKNQRDEKALSPPKVTNQARPQKGEQDHPLKPTSAADLAKNQRDEKASSPPKVTNQTRPQKGEQDRPQKPTSPVVTSEAGPQNAQNQNPPHPKPTLKDRMKEAESVARDYVKKKMETSEGHPRTGDQEMPEMSGSNKRIEARHVTAYAKQVMGKLAKRIKEDEDSKQSLINAGVAAMVILAMGTYIAYTIASRDTQN